MKIKFFKEIGLDEKLDEKKLINFLLNNRKIEDKKDFLHPKNPLKISLLDFGPYQKQINESLKILKNLHKNKEMIVVYTDYDADGITGGAILWETLYLLGFKVMPYVPDRKKEGYGFSLKGIENVIKQFKPALIISVDHGITKVKEINYLKKKGIKVIITDHHLKQEKIPKADAIFHIPQLSGAGVAYFFSKEIFNHFKKQTNAKTVAVKVDSGEVEEGTASVKINWQKLANNFQSDYLAFSAIGIIADLVPLTGAARSLVKYGLIELTKTKRLGLKHILKQAGIEGKTITPYEVGFIIAPRINASGRLENAIDALRLLCTTKENRAYQLAHYVGQKNLERQLLVEKSVAEAKTIISNPPSIIKNKIIILVSKKWHEGIIGLIASKIAEEFYRPTIVITKTDNIFKGSARSIPGFHITNFLKKLKKYLIDVGGHTQAAGFTIDNKKVTNFTTATQRWSQRLIKNEDLERKIEADLKIPISKINLSLVKALEPLEPFGIGNPRPTFYSQAEIVSLKIFGKANNHLKIIVKTPLSSNHQSPMTNNQTLELVSFNHSYNISHLQKGKIIDIIYTLEIDRWGGEERVRGNINFYKLHNS